MESTCSSHLSFCSHFWHLLMQRSTTKASKWFRFYTFLISCRYPFWSYTFFFRVSFPPRRGSTCSSTSMGIPSRWPSTAMPFLMAQLVIVEDNFYEICSNLFVQALWSPVSWLLLHQRFYSKRLVLRKKEKSGGSLQDVKLLQEMENFDKNNPIWQNIHWTQSWPNTVSIWYNNQHLYVKPCKYFMLLYLKITLNVCDKSPCTYVPFNVILWKIWNWLWQHILCIK